MCFSLLPLQTLYKLNKLIMQSSGEGKLKVCTTFDNAQGLVLVWDRGSLLECAGDCVIPQTKPGSTVCKEGLYSLSVSLLKGESN